jgi:hypothetical protein
MYIVIKRHDGTQVMSLKKLAEDGFVEKKVRRLKLQNFRGISVSCVVWFIDMSLTEIQLKPYFLR